MLALVAALVLPREGLHLPLRKQALNELANLVDVEPVAAQRELLHLLGLLVLGREGNLEPEAPRVRMTHHQIFIQPELYVRKIAQIEHVERVPRLLLRRLTQELPVVGQREQIDEGVDVGSRGEVEPGANGALGRHLLLVLVVPVLAVLVLRLPEHEIYQDLLEEGQADVLRHLYALLVSDAVLVYHHEVGEGLGRLEESVLYALVHQVEDKPVLAEIVPDCVVYLWHFRNIELFRLRIVEILLYL